MQIEIPKELIEAQRELAAARAEHTRLSAECEAAQTRWFEAMKRHEAQWAAFQIRVTGQVQELALPAEEGG
jgi:uncharacterized protein YdeI (YjbR/CyaY-like superfamily)